MSDTLSALLWLGPIAYIGAGVLAPMLPTRVAWLIAEIIAVGVPALSLIAVIGAIAEAASGTPVDGLGLAMATLIGVLGWIIVRYSERYLVGERNQARYITALMATLASVMMVTLTDNLGLLVAAWIASSLALHGLLIYYSHRPAALASAHKKFLASRLAELCLIAALGLIYWEIGSLQLSWLAAYAEGSDPLPAQLHIAMVLMALGAALKSAQMPVHGWILQVMEAPTPVSALLHAGVVNLSGFVLIRLAEPLAAAPLAQALLVLIGSITAVLSALVMMTRVSIKVRLAWSTCSQMGFMLLECGLGLYELALLHLIAHSAYKGYAFLAAGDTVRSAQKHAFLPTGPTGSSLNRFLSRLVAAPVAIALLLGITLAWQYLTPHITSLALPAAAVVIVGIGLAPLLWPMADRAIRGVTRGIATIVLLAHLYLIWHVAFSGLAPKADDPVSTWLVVWTLTLFGAFYILQTLIVAMPSTRVCQVLRRWAVAGFFMDELFTRLTFRVWPLRLPAEARSTPATAPSVLPGEPS
jgi:NAD(P)H-quinone oxidoreductase subunit 5